MLLIVMTIISHKYKFIFIKTAKVAGTSIELALRPHLGQEDIATPVATYDENYARQLGISGPQNYIKDYDWRKCFGSARGFINEHSWAYEVKGILGERIWNSYWKFTIEREALDKSISHFFHYKKHYKYIRAIVDYTRYLKRKNNPEMLRNVNMDGMSRFATIQDWIYYDSCRAASQNYFRYTVDDNVIVDKVYNYAHLDRLIKDLEDLVKGKLEVPSAKGGFRKALELDEEKMRELLYRNEIYRKERNVLGI